MNEFYPYDKLYHSIAPQAMGVILYGDTEAVQSDMERVMKELKTSEIHTMKVVDDVEQRGIILKKSTAESLLAKGLFRKVRRGRTVCEGRTRCINDTGRTLEREV
ncbi:hypothetical protein BVG16_20420 [Paenibacillus selenitireducens]|uniref:Uncharacterized protein n=1 Tax=Paenibacillus selenitireducens TaxID=1324314 RepID=A0A1T2X741_9BACL|nr:lipoprotein BA_5634 family protein [Paenibacillus selenitireducens]OPA75699.1 hypothetical protein BVG16_20420 [Paenibacillus selenitireducens]